MPKYMSCSELYERNSWIFFFNWMPRWINRCPIFMKRCSMHHTTQVARLVWTELLARFGVNKPPHAPKSLLLVAWLWVPSFLFKSTGIHFPGCCLHLHYVNCSKGQSWVFVLHIIDKKQHAGNCWCILLSPQSFIQTNAVSCLKITPTANSKGYLIE